MKNNCCLYWDFCLYAKFRWNTSQAGLESHIFIFIFYDTLLLLTHVDIWLMVILVYLLLKFTLLLDRSITIIMILFLARCWTIVSTSITKLPLHSDPNITTLFVTILSKDYCSHSCQVNGLIGKFLTKMDWRSTGQTYYSISPFSWKESYYISPFCGEKSTCAHIAMTKMKGSCSLSVCGGERRESSVSEYLAYFLRVFGTNDQGLRSLYSISERDWYFMV